MQIIQVYNHLGGDGKIRQCIEGHGAYPYIYKRRGMTLEHWKNKLYNLLHKAKYADNQIEELITHYLKQGYNISRNFYILPEALVQRTLEIGYSNIEYI